MSSLEENTSDPVIKTLCEKLNLLPLVEGQGEYEQSVKRLFNGSPSNKPKAFIKPKTADEVCQVLQYASANHLQVSVLGGGHDPKGNLRDGIPVFPPNDTYKYNETNQVALDFCGQSANNFPALSRPVLSLRILIGCVHQLSYVRPFPCPK